MYNLVKPNIGVRGGIGYDITNSVSLTIYAERAIGLPGATYHIRISIRPCHCIGADQGRKVKWSHLLWIDYCCYIAIHPVSHDGQQ